MLYFEYGRNIVALVPEKASALMLSGISYLQSQVDGEVDELIQQGEQQLADTPVEAGGVFGTDINAGILVLAAIILMVLVMLFIIGRSIRKNREGGAKPTEDPLFEDQFAIHDEEVEIHAAHQADEHDDTAESSQEFHEGTTTIAFSEEEREIEDFSNEHMTAEADLNEEDTAEDDQYEQPEKTDPDHDDDNGNVIHLKDVSEQEENVAHEDEREMTDTAPATPEETAPVHEEETAETEAGHGNEQEDNNVRYAFASTPRSPIAFSAISEDEDSTVPPEQAEEEAPRTARPYIAPTVLREDMERLEQHQASRIDNLRDDVSRQIDSMKSENNTRLDLIINAIDRKIENLADLTQTAQQETKQTVVQQLPAEISTKISQLQSTLDNQGQRIRAITQILDDRLDSVSHVYGEVRTIGERIDSFDDKLGKLEQSIHDRAQQDVMADVQLTDVIRSCLTPGQYDFKALLSNNNRADCIIRLPHPPGAIVIDTRFPLDAFNALPGREDVARGVPQAKAAEDAFRRSVLRHIIDVAERYIIPGETADSALLFLPTEAIYTTLHSRFPDLVRDSFRARVWIVSPSTLMGTLQTLRGVLRDNREREDAETVKREAQEVMTEMESLRSHASTLATNFEQTQSELRHLLDATQKVVTRTGQPNPKSPEHSALMDHLYDNKPEWPGTSADEQRERDTKSPSLFDDKNGRPDNLR